MLSKELLTEIFLFDRHTDRGRVQSVGTEIRKGNVGNIKNKVGKGLKGLEKERPKLFRPGI